MAAVDMGGRRPGAAMTELAASITTLHTNNQIMRRLLRGAPDSSKIRSVHELRARNEEAVKRGNEIAGTAGSGSNRAGRGEVAMGKLTRDFRNVVKEYQQLVDTQSAWEAKKPAPQANVPAVAAVNTPNETTKLLSPEKKQQSQMLLDEEEQKRQAESRAYASNEQFMLSQQDAVHRIQAEFGEVNSIFKDLAVVINDQGEQLDQIEANTAQANLDARLGQRELGKRNRKITARRKIFYFAVVIAAFAIALVFLVLLS